MKIQEKQVELLETVTKILWGLLFIIICAALFCLVVSQ